MKIMANITYRQVNDYMIPNLKLPPEESAIRLSKWGMMYKSHLKKHNKPRLNSLFIKGELYQHCAEVEKQAKCACGEDESYRRCDRTTERR